MLLIHALSVLAKVTQEIHSQYRDANKVYFILIDPLSKLPL